MSRHTRPTQPALPPPNIFLTLEAGGESIQFAGNDPGFTPIGRLNLGLRVELTAAVSGGKTFAYVMRPVPLMNANGRRVVDYMLEAGVIEPDSEFSHYNDAMLFHRKAFVESCGYSLGPHTLCAIQFVEIDQNAAGMVHLVNAGLVHLHNLNRHYLVIQREASVQCFNRDGYIVYPRNVCRPGMAKLFADVLHRCGCELGDIPSYAEKSLRTPMYHPEIDIRERGVGVVRGFNYLTGLGAVAGVNGTLLAHYPEIEREEDGFRFLRPGEEVAFKSIVPYHGTPYYPGVTDMATKITLAA